MSFKTCQISNLSNNAVSLNDNILISFGNNINKFKIESIHTQFYFPEFKHLLIDIKCSREVLLHTIQSLFEPFKILNKNTILTNDFSQYIVSTIKYKKYFSEFLPSFPLIEIIDNKKYVENSCIFHEDDPYGIQLDSKYIFPFSILFPLLYNLIINDGKYIFNNFKLDMIEINEIDQDKDKDEDDEDDEDGEIIEVKYYAILKKTLKFKINDKIIKFDYNDIIYTINNCHFNKNGNIFCPELNIYIPLNLYFILCINSHYTFEYSTGININNNKIVNTIIKNRITELPKSNESELLIPIFSEEIYSYRGLEFNILTEKLMEIYQDCPLKQSQFLNNYVSTEKYIVLTNHKDGLLYILKKISNKNISSFNMLKEYTENILQKNKSTFYFERFDKSIKITI